VPSLESRHGVRSPFTSRSGPHNRIREELIYQGQKLIPSVTRTFSASRPLFVFLQAYERDATTERPLVAFVTFYLDGVKAFETELQAIAEGWDPKSKAVPIRFSIPLESLKLGSYDCQVTVLDPSESRAAFWRTSVVLIRRFWC
jgi:hypothetical protein